MIYCVLPLSVATWAAMRYTPALPAATLLLCCMAAACDIRRFRTFDVMKFILVAASVAAFIAPAQLPEHTFPVLLALNILSAIAFDPSTTNRMNALLIMVRMCSSHAGGGRFDVPWRWLAAYTAWNLNFQLMTDVAFISQLNLVTPFVVCFWFGGLDNWARARAYSLLFVMMLRVMFISDSHPLAQPAPGRRNRFVIPAWMWTVCCVLVDTARY